MRQSESPALREEARHTEDPNACQDGFRYKLTEEGGRYRFAYVQAMKGIPCAGQALSAFLEKLTGAWLDELDPAALDIPECDLGKHCSRELSSIVKDLQELLLQ